MNENITHNQSPWFPTSLIAELQRAEMHSVPTLTLTLHRRNVKHERTQHLLINRLGCQGGVLP